MSSHTLNTNTCSLSLSFSLSPLWLYLAENLTMCVLKFLEQVFDKDVGQDEKLGVAKVRLIELEAERSKELELRLLPSHDMLKIKDKKDRGTITIQVIIYIHETIIYISRCRAILLHLLPCRVSCTKCNSTTLYVGDGINI